MSLNPILSQDIHTKNLLPVLMNGEAYILSRPKTKVVLSLSTRKLVGVGDTILTTHRVVFIKNQDKDFKKTFSSINVPYSHLEHPKFVQPIFATNHMKFSVKSDRNGTHPLESDGDLKILFVSGGAQIFLNLFYKFYATYRNNPNFMSTNNPLTELDGDNCVFVDPSDPSHIYFTQPETSNVQREPTAQTATETTTGSQTQEQNAGSSSSTNPGPLHHVGKTANILRFAR